MGTPRGLTCTGTLVKVWKKVNSPKLARTLASWKRTTWMLSASKLPTKKKKRSSKHAPQKKTLLSLDSVWRTLVLKSLPTQGFFHILPVFAQKERALLTYFFSLHTCQK